MDFMLCVFCMRNKQSLFNSKLYNLLYRYSLIKSMLPVAIFYQLPRELLYYIAKKCKLLTKSKLHQLNCLITASQ